MIRPTINQQNSISFHGGSDKSTYFLSIGYDKNNNAIVGNDYGRTTLNASNSFKPLRNLEITSSFLYNSSSTANGYFYQSSYPYVQIADANGNALAVPYQYRGTYLDSTQPLGFLDWKYRPLDESKLADNTTRIQDIILRGSVKYDFTTFLNAIVQYQNETQDTKNRNYQNLQTFAVRDLINRYSQRSSTGLFTYPVPLGGILNLNNGSLTSNNFRTQLNYNQEFDGKHNISAIAGAEIREVDNTGYQQTSYGYDDNFGTSVSNINYNVTYPQNPSGLGSLTIPPPNNNVTGITDRYVSYYANGSYTFLDRYIFSLSGRKDGANIFGVKTNDKVTPLWSAGAAYDISKEPFYHITWLPVLKLRITYGYNGNVYNASAYLTASYQTNKLTGAQYATITSPPNPDLRWEKIRNENLGIDFATNHSRLSGSIEYYVKTGTDLIEDALLPPSTGFSTFKGNAASVQTQGIDISLNSINTKGQFKWLTSLLFTYNKDKVLSYDTKYSTNYLVTNSLSVTDPASSGMYIVPGNSLFGVYSLRSAGLDPANGDPRGYLNGQVSKDYTAILTNSTMNDIIYHGSGRPVEFGSIRNTFSYKGISVSANIVYKFDYYFRKRSISLNYAEVLGLPNADYDKRWQAPGDELITSVPSLVYPTNANRNIFYQDSEPLVLRGDHIRLQDITVSYDLTKKSLKHLPFSSLQVYSYVNNMGILWRANKEGLDPDLSATAYTIPRTIAFGIRGQF